MESPSCFALTRTLISQAVFVRPTRENLELIKAEIAEPRFAEYHLFFSNVCPNYFLQQLADADQHEIIRQVQEYYADFMAINDDLFTINQRGSLRLSNSYDDNELFLRYAACARAHVLVAVVGSRVMCDVSLHCRHAQQCAGGPLGASLSEEATVADSVSGELLACAADGDRDSY